MQSLLCLRNNCKPAIHRESYQRDHSVNGDIRDWLWWRLTHPPRELLKLSCQTRKMKCYFVLWLQLPEATFPGHLTLVQRMGKYLSFFFFFVFFPKAYKNVLCLVVSRRWQLSRLAACVFEGRHLLGWLVALGEGASPAPPGFTFQASVLKCAHTDNPKKPCFPKTVPWDMAH